jgi:hypothetical protein
MDYIQHEAYHAPSFHDDICLLHFKEPFVQNEYVQPIELTSKTPYYGTDCLVSGWGSSSVSISIFTRSSITHLLVISKFSKIFQKIQKNQKIQNFPKNIKIQKSIFQKFHNSPKNPKLFLNKPYSFFKKKSIFSTTKKTQSHYGSSNVTPA